MTRKTTCRRCGCGCKGDAVAVDAPANVAHHSRPLPSFQHEPGLVPNPSRIVEPADPNRRRGISVQSDEGNEAAEAGAAVVENWCVVQWWMDTCVQHASIGRSMDKEGAVQHILVHRGAVILW